ncbi:MAG: hypothetical protein WC026_16685 [Hyphomicrobium sp.]|uniref:hypothetical protein n=1 Tax=Hyphomicrobium sp. TaxID=82 RepID=UPI003569D301
MAMTMRERIARAVRRAMVGEVLAEGRDLEAEFSEFSLSDQQSYFDAADAVLTELETPTDGMLKDAEYAWPGAFNKSFGECISASYAAAIRASREGK